MTTIAELINEIDRELLQHYTQPQLDLPNSSISTAATTITLTSVNSISPGSVLDIGFELMYVTAWNENNRVADVIRGLYGSTATSHATTDLVRINPRISSVAMLDAIRDEIRSWDERVFATEAGTVSFGSNEHGVDVTLTQDPYRVVWARPRPNTSNVAYKRASLVLRRNEDTDVFASGYSLHLPPGLVFSETTTVDVLYAVPFDTATLATATDLQSTVGLSDSMLEIVKWGSLSRLVAGKGEGRVSPFGGGRADIEGSTPATAALQAAAEYMRMRNEAYHREAFRLLAKYPYTSENS
jgi:hypothetical protein